MDRIESQEDYLERILMLSKKINSVRAIDIANDMSFSKASVSIALKKLKEQEYLIVDKVSGYITLTNKGRKVAETTFERHQLIANALKKIGVPEDIALKDACKIEHDISDITFEKLKNHCEELIKK